MTLKPPTRTLPKLVMKEWPIYQRRFGSKFSEPCANPNVIECALWECQKNNRCKSLSDFTRVLEGVQKEAGKTK